MDRAHRFGAIMLLVFGLVEALPSSASGAVISAVYNSGVSASGVVLANGQTDQHYLVSEGPPAEYAVASSLFDPTDFNDSLSKAIYAPADYPAFVLAFDLSFFQINTVSITGKWDSSVTTGAFDVLLNGTPINSNGPTTPGSFSIPIGSPFVQRTNYLTFLAMDLSGGTNANYFRVEMTATGQVPELSSLVAWSMGMAGCGLISFLRRRPRG